MDGITRDWMTKQLEAPPPTPGPKQYVSGLDLGKMADYSALATAERTETVENGKIVRHYGFRYLKRWQLHTDYTEIARDVAALFGREPLTGSALAVDATGVGAAVVEIIRAAKPKCKLWPVTITGAQLVRSVHDPYIGWKVPKKELADTTQALFGTKRLLISPGMPLTKVLTRELQSFTVKVNIATGNESFEAWRTRDHDDLVLAVAMAAWLGERGQKRAAVG